MVMQFSAVLLVYQPIVHISLCHRYLWFILVLEANLLAPLPNCVVTLRVYALYGKNTKLALALFLFILAQVGISLWVDFSGPVTPVNAFGAFGHPELNDVPSMRFCAPSFSAKLNRVEQALTPIMQAIFDTVALVLILTKARGGSSSGLLTLIAKQGLVYYTLNAATYTTWALMMVFLPATSKLIMSGPATSFGCVSVNRLTLHLRSYSSNADCSGETEGVITPFIAKRQRRSSWLGASTLEMPDGDGRNILELKDLSGETQL